MSDLDSYLTHCYDLLLNKPAAPQQADDEELCACAHLVTHDQPSNH